MDLINYLLEAGKLPKGFIKLAKESCTFNSFYDFWLSNLFERVMRLFVWENTGDIEGKEIEQRLILDGKCLITKSGKDKKLTAYFGTEYGPTKYQDVFTSYTGHAPVETVRGKIGESGDFIYNSSTKNAIYPLLHHYAILLAHTEVTFIDSMIDARDSKGIPVAKTEKQKLNIQNYLDKKFNGQYDVIMDVGMLGVETAGTNLNTSQNVTELLQSRERLLKAFYSDIGVRSSFEKISNTVEAEVEADTSMLLLNISDMLKARQLGAERVNKLFGTNWSVHLAEELNYINKKEETKDELENS